MRAWRGCLVKEKILEVVDLCKEYPVKRGALLPKEIGMVHAVNHVSFTLYQGETLGIIGESGCGKTTLIRMLMGLEEANGGYVQFGDKKIHRHMPPITISFGWKPSIRLGFLSVSCLSYNKGSNWLTNASLGFYVRNKDCQPSPYCSVRFEQVEPWSSRHPID